MENIYEQSSYQSEIARVAYQLWEEHGKPVGRDLEFWLEAERQFRTFSNTPRPKAKPAAKLAARTRQSVHA